MKYKFIALSLLLSGISASTFAQDTEKKGSDNIFLGVGIGGMTVINDGINSPTFNFNISVGKYITPVWGVRLQAGGFWQSLEKQDRGYSKYCKKFGEVNLDGMVNLTNLIGGYNPDRKIDFSVFAGPTMNISSAVSGSLDINTNIDMETTQTGVNVTPTTEKNYNYSSDGVKARLGAMVGFDLGYNVNNKWAINLEGRYGVTPSIFGQGSDCNKAESTARLTIGAIYTFGGKKFKKGAPEIVEREVVREVVKEVPKEVVKEVVKEVPMNTASAAAIFFKIGKSQISEEGMVNLKLIAKVMKANPNTKYKVAGYADKGTGSVKGNQTLSEKRAQAVYDALIAEGVSASQLEKVAMGGTDPMFGNPALNRVVITELK